MVRVAVFALASATLVAGGFLGCITIGSGKEPYAPASRASVASFVSVPAHPTAAERPAVQAGSQPQAGVNKLNDVHQLWLIGNGAPGLSGTNASLTAATASSSLIILPT